MMMLARGLALLCALGGASSLTIGTAVRPAVQYHATMMASGQCSVIELRSENAPLLAKVLRKACEPKLPCEWPFLFAPLCCREVPRSQPTLRSASPQGWRVG